LYHFICHPSSCWRHRSVRPILSRGQNFLSPFSGLLSAELRIRNVAWRSGRLAYTAQEIILYTACSTDVSIDSTDVSGSHNCSLTATSIRSPFDYHLTAIPPHQDFLTSRRVTSWQTSRTWPPLQRSFGLTDSVWRSRTTNFLTVAVFLLLFNSI